MMPVTKIEYQNRREQVLIPLTDKLEKLIANDFRDVPHIDRITGRAKSVASFMDKIGRTDRNGYPKYTDPLHQIRDQIGIRIVVYYTSDVESASNIILNYYRPIEAKLIIPESDWEFGYIGKHFVLFIPDDVYGDTQRTNAPKFFELQIKTLFQHAWSEANHDLGYKPSTILTSDQKRMIAFTAAQAWGADKMFDQLRILTN